MNRGFAEYRFISWKYFYQISCAKYLVNLSNQLTHVMSFCGFSCIISLFCLFFLLELLFILILDFLENLTNFLWLPNVHFLSFYTTFSSINSILSFSLLNYISSFVFNSPDLFFIPWSLKKIITSCSCFMEAIASLSCWCYQLAFAFSCFLNCLYFFIVHYLFICLTSA